MQPNVRSAHLPEPRVFQYSLDWRFLLPIADPARIHVAFEEAADFSETLERIGIPVSNQLSDSNLRVNERDNVHSFVLPFGLPIRWVSAQPADQIEFYRSIRHFICPGGYFLLGFRNSWSSHSATGYHAATPDRVVAQLKQAGFHSIKMFGAMPNLSIPEYIFELSTQALYFTLQHRFRRKPVLLNMLQVLARTIGLARLSNFFPCYFAVATA
ncbi:MAG TPA: hypothetical protein VLE49_03065 [Anaerolineales bacterium]|nr:hypothetical protein [Anaerolineales bacterium]